MREALKSDLGENCLHTCRGAGHLESLSATGWSIKAWTRRKRPASAQTLARYDSSSGKTSPCDRRSLATVLLPESRSACLCNSLEQHAKSQLFRVNLCSHSLGRRCCSQRSGYLVPSSAFRKLFTGLALQKLESLTRPPCVLQGHRDSCMCVICKQSRRTGKPWAGMLGGSSAPVWIPAPTSAAAAGPPASGRKTTAPLPRFGKRAFVRCTPQLVRGAIRKQVQSNLDKRSPAGAKNIARLQYFGRLARTQHYAHIDF